MERLKNNKIPIRRGTCILEEKPFVFALKSKYRTDRCDYCFTEGKLLKCSNCQYVYYCNKLCQKDAWPMHKRECPFLGNVAPRIVPDAARFLARIILKLNNGGDFEKGYYTNKSFRKFKDLMTHSQNIKTNKKRMEHVESLFAVLHQMMPDCLLPNESEFICIYGRMVVNSFNILDLDMNSIGTGMYLGISIMDHNCKPNAVAVFEGTTIMLRTIDDLPSLDWSKIFISYIDLLDTPQNRQLELQQNYFFLCACGRCTDQLEINDMNAATCPNDDCHERLNLEECNEYGKCSKCETAIPSNYKEQYNETIEFTKMHLKNMHDIAYLDVCNMMIKRQKILHPMNIWHVKTLEMTFESAINIEKWEYAIDIGIKLATGLRKYCGDYNPILGILYMKIGKILLYKNNMEMARTYLKHSAEIITVTHGQNHSLYKLQLLPLLLEATQI